MKLLARVITVLLQLLFANLLGFAPAVAFNIGGGWEILVFILGFTLGVWGVGALYAVIRRDYPGSRQGLRLLATLLFSALGGLAIILTPPIGFIRILYPLLGALLGYYLLPLLFQRRSRNTAV